MQRPDRIPAYRQIFQAVWKAGQKALRVVDVGRENTETVAANTVTVSTTVILPASFFPPFTGQEIDCYLQVISGGPINVSVAPTGQVTAGGAEGSVQASAGDIVHIDGPNDIARFRTVRATGGADAEVRGWLTRRAA